MKNMESMNYLTQGFGVWTHVSEDDENVFFALVGQEFSGGKGKTGCDDTFDTELKILKQKLSFFQIPFLEVSESYWNKKIFSQTISILVKVAKLSLTILFIQNTFSGTFFGFLVMLSYLKRQKFAEMASVYG